MEETVPTPMAATTAPTVSLICPQCHQPVLPVYFFCPNCGKKLHEAPLSTSRLTQASLYAFSIILPFIAYLAIGYWHGIKYLESPDPKVKQIGIIALVLLLASSGITFWLGIVWIQNTISSALTSVGSINSFGAGL